MKSSRLRLCAAFYPLESLEAAARALGARASVKACRAGRAHDVALTASSGQAEEFLNEALSHAYRQNVLRFNRGAIQPVLGGVISRGFIPVPHDPLERLEPQVAEDRKQETEALLQAARALDGRSIR